MTTISFSRKRLFTYLLITALFVILTPLQGISKTKLQIPRAGPSTQPVSLLAKIFNKTHPEYQIVVPKKSIKHKGLFDQSVILQDSMSFF